MSDGDQLALGALKSMSVRDLLTDLIEENQDVRSEVVADPDARQSPSFRAGKDSASREAGKEAILHKAVTSTKTFVHCPNCGAVAGRVDHLFAEGREVQTRFGCDSCGVGYRLLVDGPNRIEVAISHEGGISVPCLHVLMLRPRTSPVFAVISARDYGRNDAPFAGAEYYYNEHTCPTNWTADIKMLVADGDDDPHGLFEYVESVDLPPEIKPEDMNDFIHEAFPHLFEPETQASEPNAVNRLHFVTSQRK